MCITYSVLEHNLAASVSTFSIFFLAGKKAKKVNHCEGYVSFQDAERQLQGNILHHFLIIFCKDLIKLINIFKVISLQPIQSCLWATIMTLPRHTNYLHPNI